MTGDLGAEPFAGVGRHLLVGPLVVKAHLVQALGVAGAGREVDPGRQLDSRPGAVGGAGEGVIVVGRKRADVQADPELADVAAVFGAGARNAHQDGRAGEKRNQCRSAPWLCCLHDGVPPIVCRT